MTRGSQKRATKRQHARGNGTVRLVGHDDPVANARDPETVGQGLHWRRSKRLEPRRSLRTGAWPAPGEPCWLAVRPEKILISKEPPEAGRVAVKGVVHDLGYFGNLSIYRVELPSGYMLKVSAQNRRRSASKSVEWDDEVYLSWEAGSAVLLTA